MSVLVKNRSMKRSRSGKSRGEDTADAATESVAVAAVHDLLGEPPVPWDPPAPCVYKKLLRDVIDPELGINIVDLGLVYSLLVCDGTVRIRMTMTTPGCPLGAYFDDAINGALDGAPAVNRVDLQVVWDPPWEPTMMSDTAKSSLGWRK